MAFPTVWSETPPTHSRNETQPPCYFGVPGDSAYIRVVSIELGVRFFHQHAPHLRPIASRTHRQPPRVAGEEVIDGDRMPVSIFAHPKLSPAPPLNQSTLVCSRKRRNPLSSGNRHEIRQVPRRRQANDSSSIHGRENGGKYDSKTR